MRIKVLILGLICLFLLSCNNLSSKIVFLGDSLTAKGNWSNYFENPNIINMGKDGNITEDICNRLEEVMRLKPCKIFIMMGINDLCRTNPIPQEETISNYLAVLSGLNKNCPGIKIYVQSILPIRGDKKTTNDKIMLLNEKIKEISNKAKATYINLFILFLDENGELKSEYTIDGLHLSEEGYEIWKSAITEYIY